MSAWTLLVAVLALLALASSQTITPPPGAPLVLTVQFIIRDFMGQNPPSWQTNKTTHPDFERVNQQDPGIVNNRLGGDRKPALNSSVVSKTWTNATTFNWAWNDQPGVNLRLTRLFNMTWNNQTGLYEYSNSNFFPIDNDGYGNYTTAHNFHFCLEYHTQFQYRGTESFTFIGDDDVYFFVNNQLFVDLGGVHGALTATRSLTNTSAVQAQFGMTVGNVYNFDFFFCERHTTASNLKMATNILLNNCPYIDACGTCTTNSTFVTVNPCDTLQCNNGVCSCQNATCVCNAGWINGPAGNCSQKCGDGIVQGSEQCDPPGTCCTSTCQFAAANTTCPSGGRPCVNYVCTGTSTTCGVARPINSTCTGTSVAPQCQQYQCSAADGSACTLMGNANLNCTDNNACTTDVCTAAGTCVSSSQPCSSSVCRFAGTCDSTTGICSVGSPRADGTGCGSDPGPTFCVQPTCVSGTCTNTSKAANTPCGSASSDGCSTPVCDGQGTCTTIAVANAQGTKAGCTQPGNVCLQALCSGTACASSPIADGSTCTNSSFSLTAPTCQRYGCVGGSCGIININEGQSCTDTPINDFGSDACSKRVCQSGACVIKADSSLDGNACDIDNTHSNPEQGCRSYTCLAGLCTRANTNEGSACTNPAIGTDSCNHLTCVSGTCTKTTFNEGGQCASDTESGCVNYRCSTGVCNPQNAPVNVSCGDTSNKCTLQFCNSSGKCAYQNVTCPPTCNNKLVCTAATGACELPSGSGEGACCGDGIINNGEECDAPGDPCCTSDCKNVPDGGQCLNNECNPKQCKTVTVSPQWIGQTSCTDNFKDGIICTSAPTPSNQCHELRCSSGTCNEVNRANDAPCTLGNVPFCGMATCQTGTCTVVGDPAKANGDCSAAYGTVPQCNKALCTLATASCDLQDDNQGGSCTSLAASECASRVCDAGSCVYNYDAFTLAARVSCSGATSASKCLVPGCSGDGSCILLNATAGTTCDRTNNPECNEPRCDDSGNCILVGINSGKACTAARDQQCQTSSCDPSGNCVVSDVTNGSPCTRTDVGQCQDAQCTDGACVLVNTASTTRSCTPTPNPAEDRSCSDFFCQADGTCETPSPKADGSSCADANLCDTDTCSGGVCTHKVTVLCNTPTLPCQNPIGTCQAAFGNCSYSGRGQYAACSPRAAELDPRCNASEVGAYRCSTGAPDSACVPSCFAGGVCGDGIVQSNEDCDWGDARTGGPCCNKTDCKWFAELTPCNDTDPAVVASVNAQIANLSKTSDLPTKCFVQRCVFQNSLSVCQIGLDTTVDKKCAGGSRKSNNRVAILASVIPGALLALCLAGLGFYLWRRAQKAAEQEWLQEYLNSGNVRVENNAAFVETQASVNNAAFQPDGK